MDSHYPRTHISPHTMSRPRRPAVKHSNMVASKASPKASGPGKALGVLATEVDAQEHEAPEPQAGLLEGDFCHQPRDLLCGPMGDAFNLVRQAIALDNRGRLRPLFGIPLADAICVRSHARRSCSSAAMVQRNSGLCHKKHMCSLESCMSPANENKQLCNDRKLPKLALAEPHSVPEHALLPQSTLTWHQRIVGCPTFVLPWQIAKRGSPMVLLPKLSSSWHLSECCGLLRRKLPQRYQVKHAVNCSIL